MYFDNLQISVYWVLPLLQSIVSFLQIPFKT